MTSYKPKKKFNRRDLIKGAGLTTAALPFLSSNSGVSQATDTERYFFIICANGGASIIDSFLPVEGDESSGRSVHAQSFIAQPNGSNIRCVKPRGHKLEGRIPLGPDYSLETFLSRHGADTAVVSHGVSSVTHQIGQQRSLNGDGVNGGKTIAEAFCEVYGKNMMVANANMGEGGFSLPGFAAETLSYASPEPIMDPYSFAFTMSLSEGFEKPINSSLMASIRAVRDRFDKSSHLSKKKLVGDYLERRQDVAKRLENGDYLQSLLLLEKSAGSLSKFGLTSSKELTSLLGSFPRLATDQFQAQAGLAYLLAKNGLSSSVTIDIGTNPVIGGSDQRLLTAPIGFDWSHRDHKGAQNGMWSRVMETADGLITLLKNTPSRTDAQTSMWDKSLVYVATDFGRTKRISGGGSGHDLNNGSVLISPLLRGNSVYGSVDASTQMTQGFDLSTGAPTTDNLIREKHIYSLISQAFEIDFDGRIDMSRLIK